MGEGSPTPAANALGALVARARALRHDDPGDRRRGDVDAARPPGNTVISGVFNHTNTDVTDNEKGLLNDRRLAEYAYALPRTRWNASVTQRLGRG